MPVPENPCSLRMTSSRLHSNNFHYSFLLVASPLLKHYLRVCAHGHIYIYSNHTSVSIGNLCVWQWIYGSAERNDFITKPTRPLFDSSTVSLSWCSFFRFAFLSLCRPCLLRRWHYYRTLVPCLVVSTSRQEDKFALLTTQERILWIGLELKFLISVRTLRTDRLLDPFFSAARTGSNPSKWNRYLPGLSFPSTRGLGLGQPPSQPLCLFRTFILLFFPLRPSQVRTCCFIFFFLIVSFFYVDSGAPLCLLNSQYFLFTGCRRL